MEITITIKLDDEEVIIPTNAKKAQESTNDSMEKASGVYARYFSDDNPNWYNDPEYNRLFLATNEVYANDLLKKRGYVLLNEVYDLLGLPKSEAGRHVGWIYDPKNRCIDNRVIFDCSYCKDDSILIDFNVDGQINPFKQLF